MDDHQLLQRFLKHGDETAFTSLVERYLGMIYGVTYRRTGNRELAEELTQNVFASLARKASKIRTDIILPGWLHRAAILESSHAMRTEYNRQRKMNTFSELTSNEGAIDPEIWNDVKPVLDEVIDQLNPTDRDIILMRFMQEQTLGKIGKHLGKSESATQRHLQRILEQLAGLLRKRGITATTATLILCLAPELTKAAPAGLVSTTISKGALTGATSTAATTTITTMTMKKLTVIIATGSLAALGIQQWKIHQSARETSSLSERINAVQINSPTGTSHPPAAADIIKQKKLNWNMIAEESFKTELGRIPTKRLMTEIQPILDAMDHEQLTAEFTVIDAMEFSEKHRKAAEGVLIRHLTKKAPELVIERYTHQLNGSDSTKTSQLSKAFRHWLKKDPTHATAWFDREVTMGTFENKTLNDKNHSYLWFETILIEHLLATNPEAARKRILDLSDNQQLEVFQKVSCLKPGAEISFIKTLRILFPEDPSDTTSGIPTYTLVAKEGSLNSMKMIVNERLEAYAGPTCMLYVEGGFPKISQFIEDIKATPKECATICFHAVAFRLQQVTQTGGSLTRKDLDEVRAFARKVAPEQVDVITGRAIAMAAIGSSHKKLMKLIQDVHAEGASDEFIISALSFFKDTSLSPNDYPAARSLAKKISDENQRNKLLKHFK